ncbi:MAG: nickel pincer cofactor biosynthesis protein LarB [Synergistetes bacterium]|nr:nickel pincer cofactor biosynthesis protein LarB [Synergistota bacterium]
MLREEHLRKLLRLFKESKIDEDAFIKELKDLPYIDLGFAKLDSHRSLRRGIEEVIFCRGKTKEQIRGIARALREREGDIVFTHVSEEIFDVIKEELPEIEYRESAGMAVLERVKKKRRKGISVVTAGTSDIKVAEEASVIAEVLGNQVERIYDVGIAGIHRIFPYLGVLRSSNVIVVVAGMEGALPSVIAGLVSCPVIAVPTSVGYGANFNGISALLTMLNTCVPGIAVVNIDNGFGAGVLAHMINALAYRNSASA